MTLAAIDKLCAAAKLAQARLALTSTADKNAMLEVIAQSIEDNQTAILRANECDVAACTRPAHFIDRLRLTPQRLSDMARAVRSVIDLADPVGRVLDSFTASSGISVKKCSVPLGVVGIIYEARPNVTTDVIALCLKSGNSVVLRGSSEALNSNRCIVDTIKSALSRRGMLSDFIALIEDEGREGVKHMLGLRQYIDVLIPRGSAELIDSVVEGSSIPVIATGKGNCHVFVERTADLDTAIKVLLNAKLQRPTVCNAAESLLVDAAIAQIALPQIIAALESNGVTVHGCPKTIAAVSVVPATSDDYYAEYLGAHISCAVVVPATSDDYYAEYLGAHISCAVVEDTAAAIAHINKYGSHHSDAIITSDSAAAKSFTDGVDSAAVYVNASTRFTDGGEFGFGAEMGISTQKLHARGPVGLNELTSYKYIVVGNGNIRG